MLQPKLIHTICLFKKRHLSCLFCLTTLDSSLIAALIPLRGTDWLIVNPPCGTYWSVISQLRDHRYMSQCQTSRFSGVGGFKRSGPRENISVQNLTNWLNCGSLPVEVDASNKMLIWNWPLLTVYIQSNQNFLKWLIVILNIENYNMSIYSRLFYLIVLYPRNYI